MQQVERHRPVPGVDVHQVHRTVFLQRAAGAVHDHVEPAERLDRALDRMLHLRIVGHVGGDEQRLAAFGADLRLRGTAGLLIPFEERDLRTFARERPRGRTGNAGTRTGEEGNLARHPGHDDSGAHVKGSGGFYAQAATGPMLDFHR